MFRGALLSSVIAMTLLSGLTYSHSNSYAASVSALPNIQTYTFTATSSKVAPGISTQIVPPATGTQCSGKIDATDTIGSINIYASFYQNGCYTGGGYAHSNYPIEMGQLNSASKSYTAYRLSPANTKATEFLASHHRVRMMFASKEDYDLYTYSNNTFAKTCHIPSTAITVGQYTELSCLGDLDAISAPTVYFAVKSSEAAPSTLAPLQSNVSGAKVASIPDFADMNYYDVQLLATHTPSDIKNANDAPGTFNFPGMVEYNLVKLPQDSLGVVWQDRSLYQYYLTTFTAERQSTTLTLPNPTLATSSGKKYMLGSAAADELGNIYTVLVETGNPDPNYNASSDPVKSLSVVAMKLDVTGNILVQKELNGTGNPLQVTSFGDISGSINMASLEVSSTEVGIILSRQYPRSSDGLNHQGAHAYALDRNTLDLKKNWGQTSGHSMSHILNKTGDDAKFMAIEIGDNYPRGISLHRFTSAKKDTRVVYTFKTAHSQTAKTLSGGVTSPAYETNMNGIQTYKWSNDNRTYSEVGGVSEDSTGYSVVFTSEHDVNGKILDNKRAVAGLNDARNIGFVKVRPDFEASTNTGTVIPDNLLTTLGGSTAETGEYYDFSGGLKAQRVTGVKWLTNYTSTAQNASRVKTMPIPNGNLLVLWEEWSSSAYLATKMMIVDPQGNVVKPAQTLDMLRLNKIDQLITIGDAIWAVTGNQTGHQLNLVEFNWGDSGTGSSDTTPDAFSFTAQTTVARSSALTSNSITVGGINAPAAISVSGGSYSINGGAFTSTAGTVSNGATVRVQHNSSANYATKVDTTLTIGGVSSTFSSTTLAEPIPMVFSEQTNVLPSTLITSNSITVNGLTAPVALTITGGEYSKSNSGVYTKVKGTVQNGDTLQVRHTSSSKSQTAVTTTVKLGTQTLTFKSTTIVIDTVPNTFSFTGQSDVKPSTSVESEAITLAGMNMPTAVSITGGEYSLNNALYTKLKGTAKTGDTLRVRHVSSAKSQGTVTTALTVGGVKASFISTVMLLDTVPDVFSFVDKSAVALNTLVESDSVTIGGINVPTAISIIGGEYSVNDGAFTKLKGTINVGDTLRVRHLSSKIAKKTVTTTVTVGTVKALFKSTTQ